MTILLYGKSLQKPVGSAMKTIFSLTFLAGPFANKKLKSFAAAHWDAPKAARPLAWR